MQINGFKGSLTGYLMYRYPNAGTKIIADIAENINKKLQIAGA